MFKYTLVLLLSIQLYAVETFNTFLDEQVTVQKQLNDPLLSDTNKSVLTKQQERAYRDFLLEQALDKKHRSGNNTYMLQVSKIKLQISSNTKAGNRNAVLRDKITLENMKIQQDLGALYSTVLTKITAVPIRKIDDIISDEVVLFLSTYTPVDTSTYPRPAEDLHSSVQQSMQQALDKRISLDYISITFCTELIKNSHGLYNTMLFSKYGFLGLDKKIENSSFGAGLTHYLEQYNLSASLVLFLLLLFIGVFILLLLLKAGVHVLLHRYLSDVDDMNYLKDQVTGLINSITVVVGLQFTVMLIWGFGSVPIWITEMFGIVYVLLVSTIIYRLNRSIPYIKFKEVKRKKLMRKEVINLIIAFNKFIIILLALLVILKILGVNLTTVLGGLGLGGIAVAFAAKDSIANIFGSISILAGDVFDQGDWIQAGDIEGSVIEIGLRATTIRTFANAMISVPNFKLANEGIKNWDRRKIGRQIKMHVSVSYSSNFDTVEQTINDIREMLVTHPDITGEHTKYLDSQRQEHLVSSDDKNGVKRTLFVYLDSFSDSGMDILIYCFSRSVIWDEWLGVKEDVMFKIGRIIEKNGLEIAYPTMTLQQSEEKKRLLTTEQAQV